MLKKALIIAVLLSVVGLFGCTSADVGTAESPASVKIIREAEIASGWALKQMEISLEKETTIVLILAPNDKVDGYFYTISGDNITFNIEGNSPIYASAGQEQGTGSDKFTFTATQAQGLAYIIKLNPVKSGDELSAAATVFLEIQYPANGEIFMPIGTK